MAAIKAIDSFKKMSDFTTGRFYLSDDAKLSTIFKQVAAEMRQPYSLGFHLEGAANDVVVMTSRSKAIVRTCWLMSVRNSSPKSFNV